MVIFKRQLITFENSTNSYCGRVLLIWCRDYLPIPLKATWLSMRSKRWFGGAKATSKPVTRFKSSFLSGFLVGYRFSRLTFTAVCDTKIPRRTFSFWILAIG